VNKIKFFLTKYWPTILLIVVAIVAYHFLTVTDTLDPLLFPKTTSIIDSFQQNGTGMFMNMFASFRLLFPSVVAGILIALLIGVPLGLKRRSREVFLPIVYSLSVVPSILLSPFLLSLAPSLTSASRIMITYSVMWGVCFGAINGVATIDKTYLDTADSLEIHGFKRLFRVILPAASPTILAGAVSSLRSSFTVLVFAEMYGAQYGLGYFVKKSAEFGIYSNVWSGFIFLVIVLVAVLRIFEAIKDRLLAWTIN